MKEFLRDNHNRGHNYLRISLTERCNLRCTYCMPSQGIELSPQSKLMSSDEIFEIAKYFVDSGVTKIRLTGGEPLVRKDFEKILRSLASLDVELAISTNAVLVDKYIDLFKEVGLNKINVSLDSTIEERNNKITRRNNHQKVMDNILLLEENGFQVKINTVLIKGFNDDEIVDFVNLTKDRKLNIRFIEFMPFDGNEWDKKKMISLDEILKNIESNLGSNFSKIEDELNDTTKNYKLNNSKGSFGIISTVTNPFCDSCNRIRLTANGQIKNCLFSSTENDLLGALRRGEDISLVIDKAVKNKFEIRGGMDSNEKLEDPNYHGKNRSMIAIGG